MIRSFEKEQTLSLSLSRVAESFLSLLLFRNAHLEAATRVAHWPSYYLLLLPPSLDECTETIRSGVLSDNSNTKKKCIAAVSRYCRCLPRTPFIISCTSVSWCASGALFWLLYSVPERLSGAPGRMKLKGGGGKKEKELTETLDRRLIYYSNWFLLLWKGWTAF